MTRLLRASNTLPCIVTPQDWEKVCGIFQTYLSQSPRFLEHLGGRVRGRLGELSGWFRAAQVLMGVSLVGLEDTLSVTVVKVDGS